VIRPEVGVGAVAVHDGAVLLVRRGKGPAAGEWSVPGGHVEMGETLHEAIVREVLEETGLEVVVDRFLGFVERMGEDGPSGHQAQYHFVILDFAVTVLDPGRPPVAGDDAAEAAWVPTAEVSDLRLVQGVYEFLAEFGVL
jgi:8-oxo-dGTP diphosphatase